MHKMTCKKQVSFLTVPLLYHTLTKLSSPILTLFTSILTFCTDKRPFFLPNISVKVPKYTKQRKAESCPTSHKEVGQFYSPAASEYFAIGEILLRSDIRLAPSGIRNASFMANKISLKPQGFNTTIAIAIISLRQSRNITLAFSADLWYNIISIAGGMGFARCICKTNAKLAIKQNDK